MDRFTRNYSLVLGTILIAVLVLWAKSAWKPEVWRLNEVLTSDPQLASYPYQFRLRDFRDGVAVISTPRSPDFPAYSFLQVIHPKLAGKAQDDPEMIAAQQELIDHQKRAMGLMLAQPGVKRVDWELDVQWLADHGVSLEGHPRDAGMSEANRR
ncbi:MAG: hypothetical protein ACUVQI_09280 [Thermochromatium sp.]